jgi:hypothetical protein
MSGFQNFQPNNSLRRGITAPYLRTLHLALTCSSIIANISIVAEVLLP